ncbi:hypothetical protein Hypma_002948 [Hypsizygus marmoreus]|uniref:Uncharacterized protein n=1 Tax=Hypsizygus marmoreus TaxID=39966 RepID=A0A369J2X1_HYPMA|nr:hypothetical protein Hypma_002948 [Hypsizygus marmoreus]
MFAIYGILFVFAVFAGFAGASPTPPIVRQLYNYNAKYLAVIDAMHANLTASTQIALAPNQSSIIIREEVKFMGEILNLAFDEFWDIGVGAGSPIDKPTDTDVINTFYSTAFAFITDLVDIKDYVNSIDSPLSSLIYLFQYVLSGSLDPLHDLAVESNARPTLDYLGFVRTRYAFRLF